MACFSKHGSVRVCSNPMFLLKWGHCYSYTYSGGSGLSPIEIWVEMCNRCRKQSERGDTALHAGLGHSRPHGSTQLQRRILQRSHEKLTQRACVELVCLWSAHLPSLSSRDHPHHHTHTRQLHCVPPSSEEPSSEDIGHFLPLAQLWDNLFHIILNPIRAG